MPRESVDTVADIMTTDLVWGNIGSDFAELGRHPRWGLLDQIPLAENGHLSGVAIRVQGSDIFRTRPLTGDMLVSSTTPIADTFEVDWECSQFLFVVQDARVAGVLTPSDLNRQPVFAALFRIVAEFEDRVTAWLDQEPASDDRLKCVRDEVKRWEKQYKDLVKAGFDTSPIQVLGIKAKLVLLNQDNPTVGLTESVIKSVGHLRDRVCHQSPLVNSVKDIKSIRMTLAHMKVLSGFLEVE